jgi:hypothetical protein
MAVLHRQDPIGDVEDAVVVGDQQDRAALLARQLLHQGHDIAARAAVQSRGGFIGQQQRWLMDQGASYGDPLLLPAGELVGATLSWVSAMATCAAASSTARLSLGSESIVASSCPALTGLPSSI